MSISEVLYLIIIKPIEIIFEIVFYISNGLINNPGGAIIILSIVVNLLVLPLYNRSEEMQKTINNKRLNFEKWEKHIKKSFRGDERFFMLQSLYRQNDYKPYNSILTAFPLLLQIPFFIAAYHFLSSLNLLDGVSFGGLKDLGKSDGLLVIGKLSINVLPFIMTGINIVSSYVYTRKMFCKESLKLYLMSLVFLVLLYSSPSGLVFYWTLNNLFSLIKNIINRVIEKHRKEKEIAKEIITDIKNTYVYLLSGVSLSLLVGMYIPSFVIKGAALEFISMSILRNPVIYVISSFCIALGFFVIWSGIIYIINHNKVKIIVSEVLFILAVVFALNFITINYNLKVSKLLTLSEVPDIVYGKIEIIRNIIIVLAAVVLCHFVYRKNKTIICSILIVAIMALCVLSYNNIRSINAQFNDCKSYLEKYDEGIPEIHLSKNGKNVIVIMMDKMDSYFIPGIITENPELLEKFSGFTYYPNCVSYGECTNVGAPALYGGYEYSPEEMNKRDTELLVDKHNEALKVMPVLFNQNDYDVTVCDPTLAGYRWIADLSIYNAYPEIKTYISKGKFNSAVLDKSMEEIKKRNLFFYSLCRVSPAISQRIIYHGGDYYSLSCEECVQKADGPSKCKGKYGPFLETYNVLDNMSEITKIDDSDKNTFMMMSNDSAHEPCFLSEPDYLPSKNVDNTEFDKNNQTRIDIFGNEIEINDIKKLTHYQVNMSSMNVIGKWLDYLKENGVYDNTKIIIVSDHSAVMGWYEDFVCRVKFANDTLGADLLQFQSTLLVKDFDADVFNVDRQFMSNADVPIIATDGLIENARNPFTGNVLSEMNKKDAPLNLIFALNYNTETNNGYRYLPELWFSVHDDIFVPENWSSLGYH